MKSHDTIRAVQWQDGSLKLLDQRYLPAQEIYLELDDVQSVAKAISDMVVRGAPAIGITAAYGVVIAARGRLRQAPDRWRKAIEADLELLAASRPTAVNLFWALKRMREAIDCAGDSPLEDLLRAAERIHADDLEANHRMGEAGAALIQTGSGVLTHCNTGSLATGGYGTALGVIRSAFIAGKLDQVYADETRPWLQGARLTAWELMRDNIPVTLLADGAAASLMQQGKVQWVIVGADRITANGDVANKIGTYSLAVNARYHSKKYGVKFMVVAPTSTVDMELACGIDIPIEHRDPAEVLMLNGQRVSPAGAQAWNPAFDVTPAELVDVIVTERGIVESPTTNRLAAMMKNPS
ncbi:MAG: S-methyl-5-thioribose-1-phosphate isomerase [Gammaproteobacteria bacterium]|nr:S-methyl-5-thioribose-1-phosphate isomerase [Gammaproteobacteria bacterium]